MTPILGITASQMTRNLSSYESIATITGSSAASVTFSSIPSTYKSLQIRSVARSSTSGTTGDMYVTVTLNGDTAANYAYHREGASTFNNVIGSQGTASANGILFYSAANGSSTSATFYGGSIIDIIDYSLTSKYKTLKSISGASNQGNNGGLYLGSGLWQSTSAITSITITIATGVYTTASSFALYGVK